MGCFTGSALEGNSVNWIEWILVVLPWKHHLSVYHKGHSRLFALAQVCILAVEVSRAIEGGYKLVVLSWLGL